MGGEGFAVDASMITADAHRQRGCRSGELDPTSNRAVKEYLAVLDDAAFGGATPVEPKFVSPTDPAARWTARPTRPAVYAYSDNYLIDLKHAVIMDVEATTAMRQAEVTAAKTMIDRTAEQLRHQPNAWRPTPAMARPRCWPGWSMSEKIDPHIPVFDKSERIDGTFSRDDFTYDPQGDVYTCPEGKAAAQAPPRAHQAPRPGYEGRRSLSRQQTRLRGLPEEAQCCPNTPTRKVPRSIHEAARDKARAIAKTEAYVVSRSSERRSRCCSPTSNASSDSTDCDCEGQTAPATSSSSPPPPRKPKETGQADRPASADHGHLRRSGLTSAAPDGRRHRYAVSSAERVLQDNSQIAVSRRRRDERVKPGQRGQLRLFVDGVDSLKCCRRNAEPARMRSNLPITPNPSHRDGRRIVA